MAQASSVVCYCIVAGMPSSAFPPADLELVGRREELDFLRRARLDANVAGVVVAGRQGVGKTRLAREALAEARAERCDTERIEGAAAVAAVPLAAVAHLLPPGTAGTADALALMTAALGQLVARATRRPLVVHVDDAHDLDEASLALVRRMMALRNVFLVVTTRSDQAMPAGVVSLWKDGAAHRMELQPLGPDEANEVVHTALGGAVDPAVHRYLWEHSVGNPLFLRELLLTERERGVLRVVDGVWRRQAGAPSASPRLTEVVQSRLGDLDDGERLVLQTLVVAGPTDAELLSTVTSPAAVDSVAGRGLVSISGDGPEATVSLAHPIYGVVLGDQLPSSRRRAIRRRLIDALQLQGGQHPADVVRLATWRLDEGTAVAATQLLDAARHARAAFPRAFAQMLAKESSIEMGEIAQIPGLEVSDKSRWPTGEALMVTERLVRAAWESDASMAAGLVLSAVLVGRGHAAEADALIGSLEQRAQTRAEQAQVAMARAALLFWAQGRADEAERVLLTAEQAAEPADGARLARLRASVALNVGDVAGAVEIASALIDAHVDDEPMATLAAATAAAALGIGGRPVEAIALIDRFLPVALGQHDTIPRALGQLMLSRVFSLRLLGRLDEAETLGYAGYRSAAEQGSLDGMAVFTAALGRVAYDHGRLATAGRRFREADVLLRERDAFGYRPWVLASKATVMAQCGDASGAAEAIGEAREASDQPRYFSPAITLADAWVRVAAHQPAAADAAAAAAEEAARRGLHSFEAWAWHGAVRLGASQLARRRLRELAEYTGSALVDAFAAHAEAGDGEAFERVSGLFAGLGARLLAAEAAAQAVAAHDRAGRAGAAVRAAARCHDLVAGCEGARTPLLGLAQRAPTLTDREREVATLAAEGLTSKAIADRLVLSPRTVESHLYRIFTKLGVSDRAALAQIFEPNQ